MAARDIVVVGASAGGVEALMALASTLPADFPAALLVVLHIPPHASSVLPHLLGRAGALPAQHANDGELVRPGRWYVAPPDHHLLIRGGLVHLGRGPAESGHRPAIDPLFRSAASAYGGRVIGVVLSGSLDDGTAGLLAVKLGGGVAVVQDPTEAMYPSMPLSALESVDVDHVCTISQLAGLLSQLVREPAPTPESVVRTKLKDTAIEAAVAEDGQSAMDELESRGVPSAFACPDCHGVLWEVREGDLVRFRCRVGHAYLPQALSIAQSEALEESLWIALRALRENSALSTRLAARARGRHMVQMAATYETRARDAAQRAAVVEEVLKRGRLSASAEEANAEDAQHLASEAKLTRAEPTELS
jgi:two-component system chemotaxis response regulator CheB